MKTLTLLVRAYCHLCDEMLAAVQPIAADHGAVVEVIDIDAPGNAELEAAWGDRVPTLFAGAPRGGMLLCHHHLDRKQVAKSLSEPTESRITGGNPL